MSFSILKEKELLFWERYFKHFRTELSEYFDNPLVVNWAMMGSSFSVISRSFCLSELEKIRLNMFNPQCYP